MLQLQNARDNYWRIELIVEGLEMADTLEPEVFEGSLIAVWDGPYKISLGTEDGSDEGSSNTQVSNRVFGYESNRKSGVRV